MGVRGWLDDSIVWSCSCQVSEVIGVASSFKSCWLFESIQILLASASYPAALNSFARLTCQLDLSIEIYTTPL